MEDKLIPYQATHCIIANSVVVFAPHPDDEVFGCGGAILRHVAAGVPVHVVILSDGAFNAKGEEHQALIEIREAESRKAAVVLGYGEPEFWRLPDRGVIYGETLIRRIMDEIRKSAANLVYAPSLLEMHPDHRAVAMCVMEAVRRAPSRPLLALYEVGVPLAPNLLLDISDLAERKMAAMECFVSQNGKQRYDLDIAALNRYRTYTLPAKVTAAEAYILVSAGELVNDPLKLYQSEHKRQRGLGLALDVTDVPLVSVIIRSMDRPTLSESLDSVALQTYPNIEVLVVNAKGGEHSKLDEWCGHFPLRILDTGEMLQRSRAGNIGLSNASGNYMVFLDDDDWFMPEHVSMLIGAITRNPDKKAAYSGVICVNEQKQAIGQNFGRPFDRTLLLAGNYIPIHAVLFSRSIVDSGCRMDESLDLAEDWDFWLQAAAYGDFIFVDNFSAYYRIGGQYGHGVRPDMAFARQMYVDLFEKWRKEWRREDLLDIMERVRGRDAVAADRDAVAADRDAAVAERDGQITSLNRNLAESDKHIYNLMQHIEEIHNSSSWRITAPMRYASSKVKNTLSVIKLLPDIIRVGGGMTEMVKKAWRVFSREGWTGVKRRILFVGGHRNVISYSKIKPEEILNNSRFGNLAYDPLVSVIAVNFNGAEFLPRFLKSLSQQSYRNFELIIVDNNSIDNSEEIINQCNTFFSIKITLVKAGKNLGFAEGNNVALDYVNGELLALLNIDTHVHEDWLRELVEAVRIDKDVAIVASKILFWSRFQDLEICSDQKISLDLTTLSNSLSYKKFFVRAGSVNDHSLESDDNKIVISIPIQEEPIEILISTLSTSTGKIELRTKTKFLHRTSVTGKICLDLDFSIEGVGNAGFIINNAGSIADAEGMPYDRGFAEYDQGQYDEKCYLPYFCGCAALIRRAAIIDRTIFVPEFFAYYEDSELSRWINSSGFKILYAPRSIVFHRHSAASSEGSPAWMYLVKRSQLIFKYAGLVNTLDQELAAVRSMYTEAVNEELMNILINYDQQLIQRLKIENQIIKRRKVIGIYNSYWNTLGGGESHALSIAADLKQFGFVELISESDFDIDLLSKYFSIDLSNCRKLIIPNMDAGWTERFFLFVNATYHSNLISRATNSWYVVYFPHRSADIKIFGSYFFLFISQYTEKWAKAYWTNSIHGDIVYPVRMLRSTENSNRLFSVHRKKRIILSVGRFNPNGHPKKQLEIAKVFRSLVTKMSDTNQWKLILAGSLDYTRSECVEYFDLVKDCLTGLDAELLPNLEREQLNQLFSEATIYVHATGLGCDKDSEPEKFEHFGITPLEAILSGCIPVVLETGGPAELVRNLKIGYCFSSEESLRKVLTKLIKRDLSVLINECKIAQERGSNFIDVESSKPLPVIPCVYHGAN